MIININDIENITNNDNLIEIYKKSVFLDIETTGLSQIYSNIISITFLIHENGYKVYQIFCENKKDEQDAIEYMKNIIKTKKYIVTYNGNSFDIPFLTEKSKKYDVGADFDNFIKIDLYNCIKRFKNMLPTANLKLKTMEKYFNINRHDSLGGADIINLYKAYGLNPKKEYTDLILMHNYEDVYNLPELMENILNLYDEVLYFKKLMVAICSKDILIRKSSLVCKFNIISDLSTDFIDYNINYNLKLNVSSQVLEIIIPLNLFRNEILNVYYITDNEYITGTFTTIREMRKDLVPIQINDKLIYNNIKSIIKNIITKLNVPHL